MFWYLGLGLGLRLVRPKVMVIFNYSMFNCPMVAKARVIFETILWHLEIGLNN